MKRVAGISLVLAVIGVLIFFGDRIVSRLLDEELAPLLSSNLGVAVSLQPVQVRLSRLQVSSARLVMGEATSPAVVATDVTVRLAWRALLRGEIALAFASADKLMVSVAHWPGHDGPWPSNYEFLDPWLPDRLELHSGYYSRESGEKWPLRAAHWQRRPDGMVRLEWREDRPAGELQAFAQLASLPDLLALGDVDLQLRIVTASDSEPEIKTHWRIQPEAAGYSLAANLQSGLLKAELSAGSATAWGIPEQSQTHVTTLSTDMLKRLSRTFSRDTAAVDAEEFLASALPVVSLPDHKGTLEIKEIRAGDEVLADTRLDLLSRRGSLQLTALRSLGPRGEITGEGSLDIADDGWQVALQGDIQPRNDKIGADRFAGTDWHWHSGSLQLQGKGDSWGGLLNGVQGSVVLKGSHQGGQDTAIHLQAQLDASPEMFGLEAITLEMGESRISGSVTMAGKQHRKLAVSLHADLLDLNFLGTEQGPGPAPGVPVPEFLSYASAFDIDWTSKIDSLRIPGMILEQFAVDFDRDAKGGHLHSRATGPTGGPLEVEMTVLPRADAGLDMVMNVELSKVNLQHLFGQGTGALDSRASGQVQFTSQGKDLFDLFNGSRGKARLRVDFRADRDWSRSSRAGESLNLEGKASLVIKSRRLVGVDITDLAIDSLEQDLTGELSLVAGRTPWVVAKLRSERLSVNKIASWLPASTAEAEGEDVLDTLRRLDAVSVEVDIAALQWFELPLSSVQFKASSQADAFAIETLNFATEKGRITSAASLAWKGNSASFKARGDVADLQLGAFLDRKLPGEQIPLSGSLEVDTSGRRLADLLANYRGKATMQAAPGNSSVQTGSRRELKLSFRQSPKLLEINLDNLVWDDSALQGTLRYHHTSPPLLEMNISGGTLSLLPWEQLEEKPSPVPHARPSALHRAASASGALVRGVFSAPSRLLSDGPPPQPGTKIFNSAPIDTSALGSWIVHANGTLEEVSSTEGVARDLVLAVDLVQGKLQVQAKAGFLNGGTATVEGNYDTGSAPYPAHLVATFENVFRTADQSSYPRSGFIDLASQGASEAELAKNATGQAYLALGRGPADFSSIAFLNANVASEAGLLLLPEKGKQRQELRCAISLLQFGEGAAVTPYGYVAKTNSANLIGGIEVDLATESLQMQFNSRSRKGAGLSVGNMFSNAIRIEGSIAEPKVVANTTGLAWRSWAAVMTGGLSLLGESGLNRVLTSKSPCVDIRSRIRKDMCGTDQPVASSPLVCPASSQG